MKRNCKMPHRCARYAEPSASICHATRACWAFCKIRANIAMCSRLPNGTLTGQKNYPGITGEERALCDEALKAITVETKRFDP